MRFIYTFLLCLLIPVIVLRLLWKSRISPAYRQRIAERFAFIPSPETTIKVWLHSVSVGETIAAKPLIEKLLERYGEKAILVTTTTPTGSDTVLRLFGDRVLHHYFPYDIPVLVNRYLQTIKPEIVVCMETEIWPNLWHSCHQRNIPVVLANARLSTRSKQSYLKVKGFINAVLKDASLIACRNNQDEANFKALFSKQEDAVKRIEVLGDIKSDIELSDADRQQGADFKHQWGEQRLVLVAASTHEGEDSLVLDMYKNLKKTISDLLLVIVPRHPERFSDVADLVQARGYTLQRRSDGTSFDENAEVVLGDSMGEMMSWFATADVVFMGGSLVPTGGHNPLEPLACSVAVISGPHIFNFTTTFERLQVDNAAMVADDVHELTSMALMLLTDKNRRRIAGDAGLAMIKGNQGATQRLVDAISQRVSI